MEGNGCSESALPNAPLPQFELVDFVPVTFEEPVPEESANEPDPDVVLENLFRNSVGTRRKSTGSRRNSAKKRRKTASLPPILPKIFNNDFPDNKLSEDYVQEISSDSDGSTPNHFPQPSNGITVPSEVPVPTSKNSTNFEFVTVGQNYTGRDEPIEVDPLAGEEHVVGEGTVPGPMSDTALVPVPQDAPGPRETVSGVPISNGEIPDDKSTSINATVSGGRSVYDPNMIQTVINSATGPPETTNITISTAIEFSMTDSSSRNVENSITNGEDDFIEVEIKKEPPEHPEIDVLQTSLSSANIPPPNSASEVPRPISLPGGTMVPVLFSKLSGKSSNGLDRYVSQSEKTKRKTASSTTNFAPILPRPGSISLPGGTLVPIPFSALSKKSSNYEEGVPDTPFPCELPNIQPGSNVVVVMMPDGQLATVPIQSLNKSLLDDRKTSSTCSPTVGAQQGESLENPPVTAPIPKAKKRGRPRKLRSNDSPSKPKAPNLSLTAAPLSGSWTNPNPPELPAIPPSIISDPLEFEEDPLEGPEQDPPLVTAPISKAKKRGRPRKLRSNDPPSKPKAPNEFVTDAPLPGSWTNPNPPELPAIPRSIASDPLEFEEDPLEGPEQDLNSIWQDVFPSDSPNLKRKENSPMVASISATDSKKNPTSPAERAMSIPDIQNVPNGYDKMIGTATEPSVASSKPPKRVQPLWPPPNMLTKRRKKQPPVAEIPLSGSWTNPNPKPATTERDPLEGPIQKIIPWTDDNLNGHHETFQLSSLYINRSKSTQCNAFSSSMDDVSLREAAGLETTDLRRPLVSIRGYGLDVPAKQIVYNLYKYFEHRRNTYNLRYLSLDLTQFATGVKSGTVRRILKEAKKTCREDDFRKIPNFAPVVRRRNRVKYIFSNLRIDMALRECMIEHFLTKKEALALAFLKRKCHSVFGPKSSRFYGINFLRLRIKALGFVCVRTLRRKIHVEGTAVRAWRHKFLTQLNRLIEEKKNIVFTLVVNLLEVPKSAGEEWVILQGDDEIKQESRVLTVFHAANENGYLEEGFFIKDAMRNPQNATEDSSYFEWLERNVLQKIPKGSVVVLAHQRFHDMKDVEIKPNEGSSKKQIIDWLQSKVVGDVDETLPKCVLLDKVSRIPVEREYSIDSLVETYGHTPVHLFPLQRDLNPLEYVWEDIRSKTHKQGKLRFNKDTLGPAFDSNAPIFEFGWKRFKTWGNYYIEKDPLLEVAQEAAIRKLGGVWSPLITDNPGEVVDEENVEDELERESAPEKSPAKSNESDSDPDSNSDSDSDSNSSQSDSDSDSSDSDSDDSTNSESEVPLSERINCNKNRNRKPPL